MVLGSWSMWGIHSAFLSLGEPPRVSLLAQRATRPGNYVFSINNGELEVKINTHNGRVLMSSLVNPTLRSTHEKTCIPLCILLVIANNVTLHVTALEPQKSSSV